MSEPHDARHNQRFPVLSCAHVEIARGFASGQARTFEPGRIIFSIGEADTPVWLITDGSIVVVRRDGLGHEQPIVTHGAGQFTGEVSQLAGHAALAEGAAGPAGCTAYPLDGPHLRALVIGSAEVGEIVMRALILRRVGLIEGGSAGSVLVGRSGDADLLRLQGFLTQNGYPNTLVDVDGDPEGAAIVEKLGVARHDLPLMVCPNGTVLKRPSNVEAAACLGMTPDLDPKRVYDVAVVGAGPAGLAAAVYAASEGLSVLVLDQRAIGGQAGASMRIENYLGFPTGISGQALAGRAYNQALKFGAEVAIPLQVVQLDCPAPGLLDRPHRLALESGGTVQARTVVIASGARYRRPDIENLALFEGAGVSYWASSIEARLCAGEEVALVGAGNSAGQAVVFLADKVRRLHLMVRGEGLEASMSRYLIDRIAAFTNVEIHTRTEVTALKGDRETGLVGAVYRNRDTGEISDCDLHHMFLFVGAEPNAVWLDGCVAVDAKGFVVTGASSLSLETDQGGVFAIGDVRAGSTKRVAAAVGEGAAAVSQIHQYLAERDQTLVSFSNEHGP